MANTTIYLYRDINLVWVTLAFPLYLRIYLTRMLISFELMVSTKINSIYNLHIMCGYQCDKAVNKNDTREVI